MNLMEFYRWILLEYWAIWLPFILGLGFLINTERKVKHEEQRI